MRDGYNIIILSDRLSDNKRQAIPALLACSATHQYLVKAGNRTNTGLVIDTGSAREVHHFALLAGYGAEAVCPWLTFETINSLTNDFGSATSSFDGRTYWAWVHICETKSNGKCDGGA